jgi:ATP-dependent DNA ligase
MNQIDLAAPDLGAAAAAGKLAQNAEPTKSFPVVNAANEIGEMKYDGWRILAVVRDDHVDFYSRSGKTYNGLLPIIEGELLANCPPGTILDGEVVALTVQDGNIVNEWGTTQSVMTKLGGHAAAAKISYMVFDLIAHAHIDARPLAFEKRRKFLKRIFDGGKFTKVKLTPQVEPTKEVYAKLLAQGFEGMIVKRLDAPYASDKREGAGWRKAKPTTTIEAVVMGFTEGKNGFKGMVGAVVFGQHDEQGNLIERGKCSGMDMRTRLDMTHHPEKWEGKVIELKHEGVNIGQTDSGRFRFPRFKRVRPDRAPESVMLHDA